MGALEREAIVNEFNKIKKVVEASSLNYFYEESPYSARIHLRKKFRNDWIKQSSFSPNISTPLPSSRPFTSRPSPPLQTLNFDESAYQTQEYHQTTFHEVAVQKDDEENGVIKQLSLIHI